MKLSSAAPIPSGAAVIAGIPSSAQAEKVAWRSEKTKKSRPSTYTSISARNSRRLSLLTPSGKISISRSGLISLAMATSTSVLGLPKLEIFAPTWRLKLARLNLSKSATRKAPIPSRVRVKKCAPPTPPRPAMAILLCRRIFCSWTVTQPVFREKAS